VNGAGGDRLMGWLVVTVGRLVGGLSVCRDQLLYAFDALVHVDILDSQDAANLQLLGRPELGLTFTKLQCWRLTHYSKCVFMDADTLVRDVTRPPTLSSLLLLLLFFYPMQ